MTLSPELIGLIAVFVAVLIGFGAVVKFLLTIKDEITNLKLETKTSITKLEVETTTKFGKLNSKIDNLELETKTSITNLEIKMTNEISRLDSKITKLDAKFDKLEDRYNFTKEQIISINQRIDRIELAEKETLYKYISNPFHTNGFAKEQHHDLQQLELDTEVL